MEAPPAVPGGAAETLAAAAKAKRARKRSRYLSSDYDTAILVDDHSDDDIVAASPRNGEEDAAALLLRLQQANLPTADLLAALLRSAASPGDESSAGPGGVNAGLLLRFLALHRASVLAADCKNTFTATVHHHSKGTAPAEHGLPNPCRAMVAVAAADGSAGTLLGHAHAGHHIGAANAAAAPAPEDGNKKVTLAFDGCNAAAAAYDCSAQPAASSATGQAYGHHIGPAYAAPEAGHKSGRKKKMAFPLDAHNATAAAAAPEAMRKRGRKKKKVASALDAHNAASSSAQPTTGIAAAGANWAPKRAKKKARSSFAQGQHPRKPVALLLDFAKGGTIHPPSKEDLLATFRGFGSLIESDAEFTAHRARLVFGSSAAAEAAYSCAHTLSTFSGRRLQYLRPPPLPPKIPLADVRKNLERMISSLTGPSLVGGKGSLDLAEQMLRLMAKVDKTLCAAATPGPSTSAAARFW